MPKGKCVFKSPWTQEKDFQQWFAPVKSGKHCAYCKLCSQQFNIAIVGKSALKSHMNGKTHQIHTKEQGNPIHDFLIPPFRLCLIQVIPLLYPYQVVVLSLFLILGMTHVPHTPTTSSCRDTVGFEQCELTFFCFIKRRNKCFIFKKMFNDSEIVSLYSE